jgi:membrane protease YdiL (CAAX protease family)
MGPPLPTQPQPEPNPKPSGSIGQNWLGLEVVLVLGVSLGSSALYSLIKLVDIETRPGGLKSAVATVVGKQSDRRWLDLTYQLAGITVGIVPAALALLLLSRSPALAGFGIGLDGRRSRSEILQATGFAGMIGIPGLGLIILARHIGLNAQLDVTTLAATWYRYPVLVLSAIQNGLLEEVVVVGYLLTRLRQLGWRNWHAIAASAILRGSYHLYQGFGGFLGNALMGAIFGWWFTRTRRVLPLIVAHCLLDIVSFVGYAALHDKVSWI